MQKILLVLGGLAWALICFYGGLWLTFPGELAAERAAWELQEASGGAWKLQVADVKPWRVSGATLKDAQLLSVPRGRKGAEGPPSLVLRAESISAREELLPLLGGAYMTAVRASLYGGELSGRVGLDGSLLVVDLLGEDLDLSAYPFGGEDWSLDAGGLLQAKINLKLDQGDIEASKGVVDLKIEDLVLSGVSFSGFSLDQSAKFSTAHLRMKLSDGAAEVKKGAFSSDLADVEVGGEITLAEPLSRSRLNLTVTFKLAEEIDQLARLALKGARDGEGRYHFKASGTLSTPRFREDRLAARGGSSSASRRAASRPATRRPVGGGEEKKDDNGSFRDGRERPAISRRPPAERRLPDRRRPDLRDRQPDRHLDRDEELRLDDEEDYLDEEDFDEEEGFDEEGGELPPDGLPGDFGEF